jgi:hypothetical protein
MDIEQQLREMLVLRDPGARFTDDVLSRVGDVPGGQPRDGVVRLADVRNTRLGRRVLLGALVVVGAAAAMLPFLPGRDEEVTGSEDVVALQTSAGGVAADPGAPTAMNGGEPSVGNEGQIDCIDPDVLYGLLLGPGIGKFRISAEVMPQLAAFKAPRELTWLGGTEREVVGTRQVSAVYRTSLDPEAARIVAGEALNSSGWTLHSDGRQLGAGVFVSATSLQAAATYCREGMPVGMTAGALEGVTYVVLSATERAGGFSSTCERAPQVTARGTSPLDQHLPTLQLPRDPATGQLVAMQGGGGSTGGSSRRASTSFRLKDSAANVAQHFGSQMARQGWQSATSWSGTGSAGSTWNRRLDGDAVVEGSLVVTAFEDDRFTVMFRAGIAE